MSNNTGAVRNCAAREFQFYQRFNRLNRKVEVVTVMNMKSLLKIVHGYLILIVTKALLIEFIIKNGFNCTASECNTEKI